MTTSVLLAPAGWEERYYLSVISELRNLKPSMVVVPFSEGYKLRTQKARDLIRAEAQNLKINYLEQEMDYRDSVSLYKSLWKLIFQDLGVFSSLRINATTTPRDITWTILHFMSINSVPTEFSYYRPLEYGKYLSRDAQRPRLVMKRSGISFPDRPTCVLVLDGFDVERRAQLRNRYEPKAMLLGGQTGFQLGNNERNASKLLKASEGDVFFDFDCYDTSEASVTLLETKLEPYLENFNVIAASLGPKPSALTLFNLVRRLPEVGLVYIPANDYSEDYSLGLDEINVTLVPISW